MLYVRGFYIKYNFILLQALQDRMTGLVNEMSYSIDGLVTAANGEPEKLGHQVKLIYGSIVQKF